MRPCPVCGQEVTSTDSEVDCCRDCYNACVIFRDKYAPLAVAAANVCDIDIAHVGGGRWLIATRFEDGRVLAVTGAFKNADGTWGTGAALAETSDGPWCGSLFKTDDCDAIIESRVPLDLAGAVAFIKERMSA